MQLIGEIIIAIFGFIFKSIFAAAVMVIIFVGWGVGIEPGLLRVTETEIKVAGWQSYWTSVRIVVLSDLHVGSPQMTVERLRDIVKSANAQKPELVMLLGDYMTGGYYKAVPPHAIAAELGKLSAPYGVFAIMGEHDWRSGDTAMQDALSGVKITVLNNSAAMVNYGKDRRIWIVGLSDPASGQRPNYAKAAKSVRRGDSVFVMMHNPVGIAQVPTEASASFAGHTHGGLINVPLADQIRLVPADTEKRYARGLINAGGKPLFVSSGLGSGILPIRVNLRPEIAVVTLKNGG